MFPKTLELILGRGFNMSMGVYPLHSTSLLNANYSEQQTQEENC